MIVSTYKTEKKIALESIVIIIILLLMSIAYFFPLIKLGYFPKSHEADRYVLLLSHFKDSFLHGNWYPRWLPDLHGGYGYPTFVYYQPLIFFVSLFISFLPGIDIAQSIYFASWFFLFLGLGGVYFLGLEILKGNRIGALFGSALFLLTPYLAVNLHIRGDLSEFIAMCLTPWPIYFGLAIKRKLEIYNKLSLWDLFALAGSISLIMISHPITALFYVLTIVFLFTLITFATKQTKTFKDRIRLVFIFYSSILLGIILSIEYWLPILQLRGEANLAATTWGYFTTYQHALYIEQLFSNFWGFGTSTVNNSSDTMPFQLGLPHFIIALIGLFIHRKDKIAWIIFSFYIGYIILMLLHSPYIWSLPLMKSVQFPWRLLSITAILQTILGIYVATALQNRSKIQSALLIVILVAIIGYSPSIFSPDPQSSQVDAKNYHLVTEAADSLLKNASFHKFTYATVNDFLPKMANTDIGIRGEHSIINTPSETSVYLYKDHSQHYLHFSIITTNDGKIEIRQFYFPGWKIFINGTKVEDRVIKSNLSKNGTIQIPVNKLTEYEIKAFYGNPPGFLFRQLATAIGLFLFVGIFYLFRSNIILYNPTLIFDKKYEN